MYYNRWKKTDKNNDGTVSWKEFINDFKQKNNTLSLQSLLNLNSCKKISKDFTVWKEEIPWFTGNFTDYTLNGTATNFTITDNRSGENDGINT